MKKYVKPVAIVRYVCVSNSMLLLSGAREITTKNNEYAGWKETAIGVNNDTNEDDIWGDNSDFLD